MDFRRLWLDDEFRKNVKRLGIVVGCIIVVAILLNINWGGTIADQKDDTGPKVMRVTSNNNDGVYTINQDIDIIIEFNEEINIALDGEPRLALQLDDEVVYANYINDGSHTDMKFRYSIKKGDRVAKLEYTGEDALELRGATVRDNKGNLSSLLLPLTTSENSLGGNKNIRIETEDPYAIVTEYQKTKELKEYTITFNRKVSGFDMDDILVFDGQKANFRVIEENRIFKLDVTRATANNQTIVVPANCCNDVENGIPNSAGVPVPKGFYYFGGNKESGVVVTDSSKDARDDFYDFGDVVEFADTSTYGNNFVWVPVDYINDATGEYMSNNSKKEKTTGQRFGTRDYGIYGYGTYENYTETIPAAVISSIEKYQGFYVARYEGVYGTDGKMGSKLSVKNALGYVGRQKANDRDSKLVIYNYVSAATAATAINKLYSSAAAVVAHMPYGAEWDTLMKWLEECGYDVAYDSGAYGNFSNVSIEGVKQADQQNILETGNTSYTEANHIFDLAGNLWEWTQEKCDNGNVVRGGVYGSLSSETPAAYRTSFGSTANLFLCTSRPFLYVK